MRYSIEELKAMAKKIRYNVVEMIGTNKTGHLGGACSIADVITVLYFYKIKHDPTNPKMEERDRVILSKGHAALVQYAALAEAGYFPKEEMIIYGVLLTEIGCKLRILLKNVLILIPSEKNGKLLDGMYWK